VFLNLLVDYARNAEFMDQYTGVADYLGGGLYGFATIILLLVMPLMTMRLFSEERKSGTLTLLLSSPASLIEIVLGKFLGLVAFMLALVALLAAMPLSLLPGCDLDPGRLADDALQDRARLDRGPPQHADRGEPQAARRDEGPGQVPGLHLSALRDAPVA